MAAAPRTLLSHEEYFALERDSEEKHEYVAGEIFAMVGGSSTHSEISGNTITTLNLQLRGRGCKVYTSDLRVSIQRLNIYTYPDVTVVCGERQFDGNGGLLNPAVLIEVLSPATERYDRGKKFMRYQRLASLREYVLISQAYPFIERFSRPELCRYPAEMAGLAAVDDIDRWAYRCLPTKNRLTADDARGVEEAFQVKLSALGAPIA